MTKLKNRCASCGGKFGLVSQYYWGLRFCCKTCKTSFLQKQRRTFLTLVGRGEQRRSILGQGVRALITSSYFAGASTSKSTRWT
jgi:hypothetical protein